MLHTTGRAGGQPKRPKWPKGAKRVKPKTKPGVELHTARKLILDFAADYKKMCASKGFDLDERVEHRWIEKWLRSKHLI